MRHHLMISAAAALLLVSCGREAPASNQEEAAPVEPAETDAPQVVESPVIDMSEAINAALANPSRPADDAADDVGRKPGEVLAFTGVAPGMTVYEMEAGTGYYTELLSSLVGPDGKIVMQNPASFDGFLGDSVTNRLAGDRLANVSYDKTNFDQLNAEDSAADTVTWFLGPHELYFTPSDGVSLGEVGPTYQEIFRILKTGGAFVVLDHAAAPGSPETTGGTLHRIDPDIVKDLAAQAGFLLEEESDIMRNPDDDYEIGVFDPAVRRKTDRFLLRFRKPAS